MSKIPGVTVGIDYTLIFWRYCYRKEVKVESHLMPWTYTIGNEIQESESSRSLQAHII